MVSVSDDIKIWDGSHYERIDSLVTTGEYGNFSSVTISKDNNYMITGTETGKIVFWSLKHKKFLYAMERVHSAQILSVIYAQDDKQFISVSKDKVIRTWNVDREIIESSF
mmetsp:Transcript_21690/g.18695  ORF Transcript_21690/g.18695 Transcript_21690/m.18695 type:complete len:110 (-) Transcript_21690:30-359(-)